MAEPQVILLAEDRDDDIFLICKAFERAHITYPLYIVRDGEEAINYLAGVGKFSRRAEYPLPSLLLLGLKMPRADGFTVLKWIRSQPSLSSVIVIVLTMSEDLRDVNKAYELGANSFLVKPMDFDNATALTELLRAYWLLANKAPVIARPQLKTESKPPQKS